jgi:hypothetical protein
VLVLPIAYAEAPWLTVKSLSAATSLVWKELAMEGTSAQLRSRSPIWNRSGRDLKARVSAKSGNRSRTSGDSGDLSQRHRFLLDQIVPKPGGTVATTIW